MSPKQSRNLHEERLQRCALPPGTLSTFQRTTEMKKIIARCGFRCDQCVAFVKNSPTAAARRTASAGWSKYFKLNVKPESMRCNGCLAEACPDYVFPEKKCAIRSCVAERKLENCAGCEEYPCKMLNKRMEGVEKVIKRFKNRIPRKEFDRFIAPYDARTTLNRLKQA